MTKKTARLKAAIEKGQPSASFPYMAEYIRWVAALAAASLLYYAVFLLIGAAYRPDMGAMEAFARGVAIAQAGFFPEPKERLRYLAAIVVFVCSLPPAYFLAGKYLARLKEARTRALFAAALAASLGFVVFGTFKGLGAANPFAANVQNAQDLAAKTNGDFYFLSTFLYAHFYLFLCLLFPAVLAGFFYGPSVPGGTRVSAGKAWSGLVHVFCGAVVAVVFLVSVFRFPYTAENKYDFNAVYYSVVQVYNGLPMLVDGFTNIYGLYPQFVAPLLKLTGLSVLSFSALMASLSALCFALFFLFLKRNIESRALVLFGFTSIFFNCYIYPRISTAYDPYFALCPIRWLFPALLLVYSGFYLKNRTRNNYFLSYALFSAGVLWNPDFGMVTYLTLLAFYCYLELDGQDLRSAAGKMLRHALYALLSLTAVFAAYSVLIGIFYGSFPNLPGMFSTIRIFSALGFGMLPMPDTWHPWMLVALVYAIGLLYSLRQAMTRTISPRSASVFLLTVLGSGLFAYYQGRSHNWNLFTCNFAAFLLLTLFADDLLKTLKNSRALALPFALAVFFLSFSFFQTVYDHGRITELIFETNDKEADKDEREQILANAAFIRSHTSEKEKVFIFTRPSYQALYYGLSRTAAAANPGFLDLFLKTDYSRILSRMAVNEKAFFEPLRFSFFDGKVLVYLSSLYDPQDASEAKSRMLFLLKKHENRDSAFLLKRDARDMVHELLDKDFANKLDYALGKKGKAALGRQFSIQLVFRPAVVPLPQLTNSETLLCNSDAAGGFVLQQNGAASAEYVFSFNKRGILFPVVPGRWNYAALGVSGSRVQAYANGRYIGEASVPGEYTNSEEPLYIGSFKTLNAFFFGDIKEVKISGAPLDAGEIGAAWNKVEKLPL